MAKKAIIDNPDHWIITRKGDFIRIKDSQIVVDPKLETIRQKLSSSRRFKGKTPEQISKERYDKVLEEVNFDYDKLHDWLYKEENKGKVEIVELESADYSEAVEVIFKHIKSSKQKWREVIDKKTTNWDLRNWDMLVNEETGQVIYPSTHIDKEYSKLHEANKKLRYNQGVPTKRKSILIDWSDERGNDNKTGDNKYNSVVIFLHGTYGAIRDFHEIEKNFPHTKFIYPHSPILQYDMWHGSRPAPGGQCQGWINITGDAWELMDTDVCPNNPPPKKNFEEADKIIHLDYPQLRRATNHVNYLIECEIAAGILPEKIFVAGYSQGGLLTLATALTSPHKLGGFISLCGLIPRWDKLLVKPSDRNKATPILFINNSKDPWVPFWMSKKSYELLQERGYNVEFKTHPGLGHAWKNEDIIEFLEKCFDQRTKKNASRGENQLSAAQKIVIAGGIIGVIMVICLIIFRLRKKHKQSN